MVEGHVAAYRLGGIFGLGSVVLYVDTAFRPWFYTHLTHRHNCIVVPSVADLPAAIMWCRNHDAESKAIAAAGLVLFRTLLQEEGLLDYTALLLRSIAAGQAR